MADPVLPAGCRPVIDPDDIRQSPIPGYAAREDGTVLYWSDRRRIWIPLSIKTGPGGFRKVRIRVGDKVRELGLAAIILRAFSGPRPLGFEPIHFPDTNPGNNRIDNLRWAPEGSSKLGRVLGPTLPPIPLGEDHPASVFADEEIPEIRHLYRAGVGYHEIADRYQVHPETIRNVLVGNTWRHIPDPLGPIVMRRKGPSSEDCPLAKLTQVEADEIRGHIGAGMTVRSVAEIYEVSISTVRDIIKGRTWKTESLSDA